MNYKDLINAIMTGNKQSATEMFKTAMEAKANEALDAVKSTVYPQVAEELSDEELGQSIIDEWTEEDLEKLIEELVEELDLTEEQIDELSSKTLGSYIKKASVNIGTKNRLATDFKRDGDAYTRKSWNNKDKEAAASDDDKATASYSLAKDFSKEGKKRESGVKMATDKLVKKAMGEDTVSEKAMFAKMKQKLSDMDKKKEKADAEKSLKKTVDGYMSVGQKPKQKNENEEAGEQVDELSINTLKSYADKAFDDAHNKRVAGQVMKDTGNKEGGKAVEKEGKRRFRKASLASLKALKKEAGE